MQDLLENSLDLQPLDWEYTGCLGLETMATEAAGSRLGCILQG